MKTGTKLRLILIVSAMSTLVLAGLLSNLVGTLGGQYSLAALQVTLKQTVQRISQQRTLDRAEIQPILDAVHSQKPALRLELLSSSGNVIYDTTGVATHYNFSQITGKFINMPYQMWRRNEPLTFASSVSQKGRTYYLLLSLSSNEVKPGELYMYVRSVRAFYTHTSRALFWFMAPIFLSILVPLLISLRFFSSINRRLQNLNSALNQVSLGTDPHILEDPSRDEIGQLARYYNSMAQRISKQANQIEQLEARRKLLISNLSHDLRTPLTMILGYAETIRTRSYKDEQELQVGAKIILQRSRYMNNLLGQLLDVSRQDGTVFKPQLSLHNLSELVRRIVADYMLFLDGQEIVVEAEIPEEDVELEFDATLMERAVRNLLDNAVRYGYDGHFLKIALEERHDTVYLSVADHGKGISSDDRDLIFERFYRGASRSGEGLGIGLSIVKEIVELHRGTVQFTSTPNVETVFQIQLPKQRT
ncbi:HAMP domain-containing sensor histidine kinase [Alicyclobacillus sp. ALC3]|uniref:HAMP domain-containing sensor histidine kinase n=1 Tax=Alicyclobacillus sp. ALC3 TaxID=2796143 RepID=UPI0023794EA7|nr:HAMP domain-containing sensor histidine kinase [Alicyclobacillus sp. ALC3]WDL95930.1 HAMP domain-containing protein [Alicyclobacillus sp. ALC3]